MTDHVSHLVNLLTYVAQRNNGNEFSNTTLPTPFHCSENEPLVDLVVRLSQHIRCSASCFAAALVYIDRVTESNPDLPLNLRTVNLLFTTSLLLANQFLDDKSERALQFANVARVHPVTMANLKTDFLFRIRFHLTLSEADLHGYSDRLQGQFSTSSFEQAGMWNGLIKLPPVAPSSPIAMNITPTSSRRYSRFIGSLFRSSHPSKASHHKSLPNVDAKQQPNQKHSQVVATEHYNWAAASHGDSLESSMHFAAIHCRPTQPNWIR